MAVPVRLKGSESQQRIDPVGGAITTVRSIPPIESKDYFEIFRQYFTDDGTSSGSNDMRVDGSSTAVDFWIPASETADRYIVTVSFLIADASSSLDMFGGIAALTNGVRFFYGTTSQTIDIHDAMKKNFDFVRLAQGQPSFGDGATAFQAPNIGGAPPVLGYVPSINLAHVFGLRWGVRLRRGSNQKLVLRVRDDVTGVDQFDAIAHGFNRLDD